MTWPQNAEASARVNLKPWSGAELPAELRRGSPCHVPHLGMITLEISGQALPERPYGGLRRPYRTLISYRKRGCHECILH